MLLSLVAPFMRRLAITISRISLKFASSPEISICSLIAHSLLLLPIFNWLLKFLLSTNTTAHFWAIRSRSGHYCTSSLYSPRSGLKLPSDFFFFKCYLVCSIFFFLFFLLICATVFLSIKHFICFNKRLRDQWTKSILVLLLSSI